MGPTHLSLSLPGSEVKDFKHLNEVTSALGIPQENISTKSIVQLREELKLCKHKTSI